MTGLVEVGNGDDAVVDAHEPPRPRSRFRCFPLLDPVRQVAGEKQIAFNVSVMAGSGHNGVTSLGRSLAAIAPLGLSAALLEAPANDDPCSFGVAGLVTFMPAALVMVLFWLLPETRGREPEDLWPDS